MNREFTNLLVSLQDDLAHPDMWWQFVVLLVCLLFAKVLERVVRTRNGAAASQSFGEGGVRRLMFPLTAMLLIFVARAVLRDFHPVSLLSIAIPLLGSMALIRAVFFILRVSFASALWLASFERVFAFLAWSVVALHIVGVLPQVIAVMEDLSFSVGRQKLNLWIVAQGLTTVVTTLLAALWVGRAIEVRLQRAQGLDANLRLVFARVVRSLLALVAVLVSLPLVGIDLTTLSVFGGALGVGLGFGLQKIASNYVSGFIILLDRSIRIGNVISVAGERGEVTRITTRYTVLRGMTGVEVIVPNEVLVGSVVENESLSDHRVRLALPVQVAYGTDLERALALLEAAAAGDPRVLADPPPQSLVLAFADSGINLEIGFWIADPEAGSGLLRSRINLAIWHAFKNAGVEIPFPQREVRLLNA
ncbi:MAG: mechanosensitive ion channel [Rhodocyclaceae bacterium]|nr:mechanosensitive ion channel [Rhodocyclaceae bacterium]